MAPHCGKVRCAITDDKQRSQRSLIGSEKSRAPPGFRAHVNLLVLAAFAVVNTRVMITSPYV
jgi:hypothetical protein